MLSPKLVDAILEFRRARDWEQFHTARNVASALSVEAAELLEHFVWSSDQQIPLVTNEYHAAIASEIADIAILLTYLSHDLAIDLESAVSSKITETTRTWPRSTIRSAPCSTSLAPELETICW
jgi:dCTP diphosphatase